MFKNLHNNRAQATVGEYLLVFFLITGMITAMTIYFRRALQARAKDTRNYMFTEVAQRTQGVYSGNFFVEYEPYYSRSDSVIFRDLSGNETLSEGGTTGIYQKDMDDFTSVRGKSRTLAPKDAE